MVIGSHLDTQWAGGRFDGILGVLAGLEVLRSLDDNGSKLSDPSKSSIGPMRRVRVFSHRCFARSLLPVKRMWNGYTGARTVTGHCFVDELERIGYRGTKPVQRSIDSYFELHIEQGAILPPMA